MNITQLRASLVEQNDTNSNAFHDTLKKIMDLMGVTTGDVAGQHFTFVGDTWEQMDLHERLSAVDEYLKDEINNFSNPEEKVSPMELTVTHDRSRKIFIDGMLINDEVFDNEMVNYCVVERADQIAGLCMWIGECKDPSQRQLMMDDLAQLNSVGDEFVLSSILTNEFLSPTADTEHFNEVCQEIIEQNNSL